MEEIEGFSLVSVLCATLSQSRHMHAWFISVVNDAKGPLVQDIHLIRQLLVLLSSTSYKFYDL